MKLTRKSIFNVLASATIAFCFTACSTKLNHQKAVKYAETQTDLMLTEISKAANEKGTLVSPRTIKDGQLK